MTQRYKIILKNFTAALGLLAVMLPFQNCGLPFSAELDESLSASSFSTNQFAAAKTVLRQNCATCHSPLGSGPAIDFNSESALINSGMVVPGNPNESKLIYRLQNFPTDVGSARNMPLDQPAISDDQYSVLKNWILTMSKPGSTNVFTCNPNEAPSPLDARRLTKKQVYNALHSLIARALGDVEATAILTDLNAINVIPSDARSPFSTGDTNFSILHAREFFSLMDRLANELTKDGRYARFVDKYIGYNRGACVYTDAITLNQECRETLTKNFLLRAWGRPVETTDANLNNEMAAFRTEFTTSPSSREGVNAMIFKGLLSPQFLFHLQIDVTLSGSYYKLSSYLIARRLAFALTQNLPDEDLLNLAATQDLSKDAAFASAVNSQAPKMDETIRQFSQEWLRLDEMPNYMAPNHAKTQYITQGISADDELRQAMKDEVVELFSYVAKNDKSAQDLLNTNISFARNPNLMLIYKQNTPAPSDVNDGNAVRFPANERSGLLTRAAMLFSGTHTENPVLRGVHIRKWVLCSPVQAPPPNLGDALQPPANDVNLTTRERYHAKTSAATCIGCHAKINPVGFAFSKYNAFGGFQTEEPIFDNDQQFVRTLPTDSRVNLQVALGINSDVNDAIEFSSLVSESQLYKRCLTENFYTYLQSLSQMPNSASSCSMKNMYNVLDSGGSLKNFMTSTVIDSRFRYRRIDK